MPQLNPEAERAPFQWKFCTVEEPRKQIILELIYLDRKTSLGSADAVEGQEQVEDERRKPVYLFGIKGIW